MNRFTSNASLVLHPENPDAVPDDIDHIITRLQQIGLTSDKLPGDEHCYLAGEHFLDLVAFMGCSPSISFSPGAGADPFSFIRLITTPDRITTFTGRFSHAPHCPHCNKPEKNWRDRLSDTGLLCSSCDMTSVPWLYNWRKSAGFARFFIEITEIYPKEAIPQPGLLSALETMSDERWKYFYHHL